MSDQLTSIALESLGISALVFLAFWVISIFKKDASIVDILWGPACALPGVVTYVNHSNGHPMQLLLVTLVSIWALRLGLYLGKRNLPHGEDYRYVRMRQQAGGDGPFIIKSLWFVFGMQCVLSWLISFPAQFGMLGLEGNEITMFGYIGTTIWFIGIFFEAVGDHQLTTFKKDPENQGKLMTQGLWSWTRHPNYFGDAMVWIGLTIIALSSPYGIYTVFSPLVMTFFLVKVSGKALTERHMSKKYPEYEAYKASTSGFIPMPPRKSA
ncbi:DUF1295 domain-containing protein [Kordiimonas laminariae]|uniref:DUF1295 domain-containing protein n=1 Tax=Kordiimonas laminariae TaxID=2917717 RepID=UPI001FF269F2|nr:DUF1295 domain-containing protein [Kordiimonas laminariae]MCK0069536.1 DUF1295 domain-containing protein [Kordiimonas laminariae]